MRPKLTLAAIVLLAVTNACSNEPTIPVGGETITLTASQAASLVGRIEAFASEDPTLAALADTVGVVINAGASARRMDVTVESGVKSFYAVSLHRTFTGPSSPWSTFHVIAFDDPAAPTRFIILGGNASVSSGDAPSSVSGNIGTDGTKSLTAHIFTLAGSQLEMWHATTGTVSFSSLEMLEACSGFPGPGQCRRIQMEGVFNITGTINSAGTAGTVSASGSLGGLPGIKISD
jgi:hypothetical protein